MSGFNIVGVQFRRAGKIYDFDARDFRLSIGDRVVVETERGPSLAEVKRVNFLQMEEEGAPADLKPIVRIASRKDLDSSGRLSQEHAESFTKQKIKDLDLEMRVINVEIQFGGNKVIVYFSAPGRVDFRELVKELAGGLKTRVELKQVGSRDEAKLSGGIGICGREFCCSSFLREFVPVSIKMAKNQNLALNPSKVSGGCGRLLCCLTYEDDTYSALRQKLLPKGARVRSTLDGVVGDVIRGDILNQTMLVELDTGELRSIPLRELELVDTSHAIQGAEDDWGSDLDFGALIGEGDIAELDDSEEVAKHRESAAEPIHDEQRTRLQAREGGRPSPRENRPQPQNHRQGQSGGKPQPGGRPQPRGDRPQGHRDGRPSSGPGPQQGGRLQPTRDGQRAQRGEDRGDGEAAVREGQEGRDRRNRQKNRMKPRAPEENGGGAPQPQSPRTPRERPEGGGGTSGPGIIVPKKDPPKEGS
jgi:cell fate regulator YaaT (PSP1 superfamily)